MMRYTDAVVGRIVAGLADAGLSERTVIIFCGDNGTHRTVTCETPHGPYVGGKGELNDRGTWVPLIVAGAAADGAVPVGVTDDRPIDFTDLLPAACTLAGTPMPENGDWDGVSPFAPGGGLSPDRREAAFIWYDPRHNPRINERAGAFVRDGRYRLHADGRFFDAGDPLDPAAEELTNRALTRETAAAWNRLRAVLSRYEAEGGVAPDR
jgi:arylsulfatase A